MKIMPRIAGLAFVVFLASCDKKENGTFTVEGKIKNPTADLVLLEEASLGSEQPVIVDSARIGKDGSFELSTLAKEENLYVIRLTQQVNPIATVINDSKKVNLEIDLSNPAEPYKVKGSEASRTLIEYLRESNTKLASLYNMTVSLDSLSKIEGSDSLGLSLASQRDLAAREYKTYATDLINKSKSPSLAIFILGSYQSYANSGLGLQPLTQDQVVSMIDQTANKFPKHTGIATIRNNIKAQTQQQAAAPAGGLLNKPAPDFTLNDVNGKPVSLSSFKGKYVLVDFWASWCGPCRAENPNVVKAYEQFKNKNFTILGVSLDKEKGAWEKAISADRLAWTHVSDLKFWESMVVPLYGINAIPYNVLLDPNGVVIAESLTGDALSAKLAEVIK